jgi:anti-sigma regulatory factor (Ser/Thr protein kinase)
MLLVSELLSNAILHAHGDVILELTEKGEVLRLSVIDSEPRMLPALLPLDVENLDEHGRGLLLVSTLAERWGAHVIAERGVRSKVVWFELAVTGAAHTDAVPEPRQPRRIEPTGCPAAT